MTEKEKALELVDEFYKCMPFRDTKITACYENPELIIEMEKLAAKQCALIAADEIIASQPKLHVIYWQRVKEEINKLV